MNYNVKIDLKKLEKVAVMNIQGKNGLIKCVVIPVEENNIFVSEKANGGSWKRGLFKNDKRRNNKYAYCW